MKNGSNARTPHTQNARAGHPPVVQKKGRNPLHHTALYALQYKRPIFTSFYKAWLFQCTSDYFVHFILDRETNQY